MKCTCDSIGQRNRRLIAEKPGGTAGADGHSNLAVNANWTEMGRLWASMKTRGGREGRVFNQVQSEVTHIIEGDYRAVPAVVRNNINPEWRLRLGSRIFNITAAYDVDDAHETLRIEATEVK